MKHIDALLGTIMILILILGVPMYFLMPDEEEVLTPITPEPCPHCVRRYNMEHAFFMKLLDRQEYSQSNSNLIEITTKHYQQER